MAHQNNHDDRHCRLQDDDRTTFTAVQVERYLKRKALHRFCSDAEKDVILQIIEDCWEEISHNTQLSQMDTDHKIDAFYSVTVIFPYFVAEKECIINVDFKKKVRIQGRDMCSCGSGRAFMNCCGTVSSLDSLLNGSN